MITLLHGDSVLQIDERVGNLPLWRVDGRVALHAAAWRDEEAVQADPSIPLVNKRLAGDFLCMPFGKDDLGSDPIHGHPANSPWEVIRADASTAHLRLSVPVRGATIEKRVQIAGPVLYQTHHVTGGQGAVSFAHHPMARMAQGGALSFSPKRAVLTDPVAQSGGRPLWALNQTRPGLTLSCIDGSEHDIRSYPARHAVEDFCILAEAADATLGWTVLLRHAEQDMLVVLKDARIMPVTMLWISNGGRAGPPWNGRHKGVIGIEDGCAAGATGLAAALGDNRLTAMGIPTALSLGQAHLIRHAMVSLPRPPGWNALRDLRIADGALTLTEAGGAVLSVPFDGEFFA